VQQINRKLLIKGRHYLLVLFLLEIRRHIDTF